VLKLVAPAALAALLSSSAFALPAASLADQMQADGVQLVQYRHDHRPPPPRRYSPGARLHAAPHGWRRYGARPRDWRTRGCVLVGPVWFCP